MPDRFEIYIVYKRRFTNTVPFLSFPIVIMHSFTTYFALYESAYPQDGGVDGGVLAYRSFIAVAVRKRRLSVDANYLHRDCRRAGQWR